MNERIRELADQILPNEKEFHQGDPKEWGYFFTGEELEKFAELIVRECIKAASDPGDRWIVGDTWHDGVRSCVWSIQDQFDLDRNFGIEEW
jgi:hypothetical protein